MGAFLRAVGGYKAITSETLYCSTPILSVRPGELRHAEWSEFDFSASLWKIPATKMKMKRPQVVPLSRQALEIFKWARTIFDQKRK